MMDIEINVIDNASPKMKKIIQNESKILSKIHENVAFDFKLYLQESYLSGNPLKSRTGGLKKAVKYRRVGKTRVRLSLPAKFAIHETGGFIMPKRKKALKFVVQNGGTVFVRGGVRIKRTRFFTTALRNYESSGRIDRVANATVSKMIGGM